uniref:Uncharacterized protein n=1 Tax=viral metagenome TaxID=1070528 RepID=A0A6C0DS15_9ZZZZ
MRHTFSQTKTRKNLFITYGNTVWLYPQVDIEAALATTTYPHTYDGDFITCPDMTALAGVYYDIFAQTAASNPTPPPVPVGGGNPGYTVGVGTLLQDMGRELRFRLSGGEVVVVWRLVKQLTPQRNPPLAFGVYGQSLNETVGYTTTFLSFGVPPNTGPGSGVFDEVNLVRVG